MARERQFGQDTNNFRRRAHKTHTCLKILDASQGGRTEGSWTLNVLANWAYRGGLWGGEVSLGEVIKSSKHVGFFEREKIVSVRCAGIQFWVYFGKFEEMRLFNNEAFMPI